MIKKFMTEVCWGDLDYLLIDTPPGTSDEHLAVMENIKSSFLRHQKKRIRQKKE